MVHLVHYELRGYGRQYGPLIEKIQGVGPWCRLRESTWLIDTQLSTQAVAELLGPLTIVGDPIFVTRIHRDWYSYSLTQDQIDWLQTRNFESFFEQASRLLPLGSVLGRLVKGS